MLGEIRIKNFTMSGDGIFGLNIYGVGERIGNGSCEHNSKIFIGDIYIHIYIYTECHRRKG
jgi:hypothetical protein